MIVRQHCCKGNTHFPAKMKGCESIPHTIASYIGSNSAIDHIISIEHKNTIDVSDVKILPYLITDHKPIFCIINTIPILSWNIEGLCNESEMMIERTKKIKKVLKLMHKKYPTIIFLFQEVFLKNQIKNNERLKDLFIDPTYTYKSDNFTSAIIIPKYLFKSMELIHRENSHKTAMVIGIKSPRPFYLVNIHLKAVQSTKSSIDDVHSNELNNILSQLGTKFKKGVVFIGDHNNTDVLPLYVHLVK
jgi:hypothetical protein